MLKKNINTKVSDVESGLRNSIFADNPFLGYYYDYDYDHGVTPKQKVEEDTEDNKKKKKEKYPHIHKIDKKDGFIQIVLDKNTIISGKIVEEYFIISSRSIDILEEIKEDIIEKIINFLEFKLKKYFRTEFRRCNLILFNTSIYNTIYTNFLFKKADCATSSYKKETNDNYITFIIKI